MEGFNFNKIDNNKMRDNILYFAKLKGIKIGEIERAIGKRLGYVARWRKNTSQAVPVEDVYNISRILGVTVEDIIVTESDVLQKKLEIEKLNKELEKLNEQLVKIRLEKELRKESEIENIKQQIRELESSDE